MLTATQKGAAGEDLLAACVTLSSDGELELYKRLSDDDHTDISAGRRGKVPSLAIQIKTALELDPKGYAVARMYFSSPKPREHPTFIYAIVYLVDASIEVGWQEATASRWSELDSALIRLTYELLFAILRSCPSSTSLMLQSAISSSMTASTRPACKAESTDSRSNTPSFSI